MNTEIAKVLNKEVNTVLKAKALEGFEKAYLLADSIEKLQTALTPQYMRPIMALQGNKLGFKTDKDKDGGYSEPIVKNCLIEAVLIGLQPFGNQFNIIAGNMYPTKEGMGSLLDHWEGLSYKIKPRLPRINALKDGAAVEMEVEWTMNAGVKKTEILDIPVKMNSMMGVDAVIGKATRKARAWLYHTLSGFEIADGDITDLPSASMQANEELEPWKILLKDVKTLQELEVIEKSNAEQIAGSPLIQGLFITKRNTFLNLSGKDKASQATKQAEEMLKKN